MDWTQAGVALAVLAPIGALLFFIVKLIIRPIVIVIENNTTALDKIDKLLIKHDEEIQNHEGRIIKIEVTHELQAKGEWNGRLT